MAFERKDNTGAFFKNDQKEQGNEQHEHYSDYRGEGKIDGVDYWMDAWINTSKDGRKYMSVRFRPKVAKSQEQAQPKLKVVGSDTTPDPNDDIPF